MYSAFPTRWGSFASVSVKAAMMSVAVASVAAMLKGVKFDDVGVEQGQWADFSLKSLLYQFVSFSMRYV